MPGAVGDHVGRIQQALIRLDGAAISEAEIAKKRYGSSTANAVLAYKKRRDIVNRDYQTQADNIVGKMTIARLDAELLAAEQSEAAPSGSGTTQAGWRWCRKCQGLAFAAGTPSVCPVDGAHDHSGSGDYLLVLDDPSAPGQSEWRWCRKCQGLAFGLNQPSVCPAGGAHDHTQSGNYTLTIGEPSGPGQSGWRWCSKCQGLAFAGSGPGICPAEGHHDHGASGDYTLLESSPCVPSATVTDMLPTGPIDIPADAFRALARLRESFHHLLPDGVRYGIGFKSRGGHFTPALALVVFVPKKKPATDLSPREVIPAEWDQYPTDVVQSNPQPLGFVNDEALYRPLRGGIAFSTELPFGGTGQPPTPPLHFHGGTIGCVVQRRSDGRRLLLIAAHSAPVHLVAEVYQPRRTPANPYAPRVGTTLQTRPQDTQLDCALIEPDGHQRLPLSEIVEVGSVQGSATALFGVVVKKRGRTTGLTHGRIVYVEGDGNSMDRYGIIADPPVIITLPPEGLFAWSGDSGSAVLNEQNEVVALLTTGDLYYVDVGVTWGNGVTQWIPKPGETEPPGPPYSSIGWAEPIKAILDALEVDVAVNPPRVTAVQPNTALAALANAGSVSVFGYGFDPGSQVKFGNAAVSSPTFVGPTQLDVVPPIQFLPGQAVDVTVANAAGEWSTPSSDARFTYGVG